jgi:hypothetical protein
MKEFKTINTVSRDPLDSMRIRFDSRVDTTEIDTLIKTHLPLAELEDGVFYVRWATLGWMVDEAWVQEMKKLLPIEGYFIGTVLGKPLTALFFWNRFPDAP